MPQLDIKQAVAILETLKAEQLGIHAAEETAAALDLAIRTLRKELPQRPVDSAARPIRCHPEEV